MEIKFNKIESSGTSKTSDDILLGEDTLLEMAPSNWVPITSMIKIVGVGGGGVDGGHRQCPCGREHEGIAGAPEDSQVANSSEVPKEDPAHAPEDSPSSAPAPSFIRKFFDTMGKFYDESGREV